MSDSVHPIQSVKQMHRERLRPADYVLSLRFSCSLSADELKAIAKSSRGKVFTFAELIDRCPQALEAIKANLAAVHVVPGAPVPEFGFLLRKCNISNVHTPDQKQLALLGATLALKWPSKTIGTQRMDCVDGFRKLIDVNGPMNFAVGALHSVNIVPKDCNVSTVYKLIDNDTRTMHPIMTPDGRVIGTKPIAIEIEGNLVKYNGPVMTHACAINNDTMYTDGCDDVEQGVKFLSTGPDGGLVTSDHVKIPKGSYLHGVFKSSSKNQSDPTLTPIPIDRYVVDTLEMCEQMDMSRSCNMDSAGICFSAHVIGAVSGLKFDLEIDAIPLVEKQENGQKLPFEQHKSYVWKNVGETVENA